MTNNSDKEHDDLDQELFDQWIAQDHVDDSPGDHQQTLREQVLAAYDTAQADSVVRHPTWSARQILSVVAALAACLLAIVQLSDRDAPDQNHIRIAIVETDDNLLLAELISEVHQSHESLSPDDMLMAIAICHNEYEAQQMHTEENLQLHWEYESLENLAFPVSESQEG